MARTYAPIHCTIWSDPAFLALSSGAQRLYILALSQPTISLCGVVAYTPKRWALLAPDTSAKQITKALSELVAKGFVLVDEDTEELMIRSFVKHDGIEKKPNVIKGMWTAWQATHSPRLRAQFLKGLPKGLPEHFPEGFDRSLLNPSETQCPTTSSITRTTSSSSSADDEIASLIDQTLILLAKLDLRDAQRKGVQVRVPQKWLLAAKQTRVETGDVSTLRRLLGQHPTTDPERLVEIYTVNEIPLARELCGACVNGLIVSEDDGVLGARQCDCQRVSA